MNQALEIPIAINAEEYLIQERIAIAKSEFVEGILYAMAGASEEHNLIIDLTHSLLSSLKNRHSDESRNPFF